MGYSPSKAMRRCNHLVGEIDGVYHEMALKLGLSDSAMIVLYTVCDSGGPCPLRDICRRSGLTKQTVNSAIRKLEREGILYLETAGPKAKNVCRFPPGARAYSLQRRAVPWRRRPPERSSKWRTTSSPPGPGRMWNSTWS